MSGMGEGGAMSGRERWLPVLLCAVGFALLGCDDDCNRPPVLVYSLNVEVADAATGEPICDATVEMERDGADVYATPGTCRFSSSTDRPGRFRVSVQHPDYEPAESEVVVSEDEC